MTSTDPAVPLPSAPNGDRPAVHRARAVLLAFLVVAMVALALSEPVHAAVLNVFDAAKEIMTSHPVGGPALFIALSALAAMLAFFSSAVLVPAAVYAWGPAATTVLLWSGWMLGGVLSYTLARVLGRRALRWMAPGRSFTQYEEKIHRHASFRLILLFQLALPSEIPGLVLGLARFPLLRYLGALAIAELPYAVMTMLLGASFVSRRIGVLFSLGALALLMAFLLGRALRRRLRAPD